MKGQDPRPNQIEAALRRYAERVKISASPASHYLCARPLKGSRYLSHAPEITLLVTWGIFNPMGPTIGTVFLVDVPGRLGTLIACAFINPFDSESIVAGLVEGNSAADSGRIVDAIGQLFRLNGFEDYPLIVGLPTYVMLSPGSPVDDGQMRSFFFHALKLAEPVDLKQESQRLIEYRGDPWSRTPSFESMFFEAATETDAESEIEWPPPRDDFNRWWEIVTHSEHQRAEIPHMQVAWKGAIGFQADMGNRGMAESAMTWEQVAAFLLRVMK